MDEERRVTKVLQEIRLAVTMQLPTPLWVEESNLPNIQPFNLAKKIEINDNWTKNQ